MRERIKEKTYKIIENIEWIILAIAIVCLVVLARNVLTDNIAALDNWGYGIISQKIMSDNFTPIVKLLTNFAGMLWLVILSIILVVGIKNRKIGISIFANLCLSALTNYLVKQILQRPRPLEEYRLIEEKGYSFPSGHSMVSMAFYGYLIYLINKKVNNKYIRIFGTLVLGTLIFCIGTSRIYLGVHYTSDVCAGFLLGISYLIIFVSIMKNVFNINGKGEKDE